MHSSIKTPVKFYEGLAEHYDDMTQYEERIKKEHTILESLRNKYKFKTALDTACGTGLQAILLQQMGVNTVGMDISQRMLEKAKINARRSGVKVKWIHSTLQKLQQSVNQFFDVILCLGNSLPHITNNEQLPNVLDQWYQLLNPGGRIIIQLLNYQKILREEQRIINVTKYKQVEYIRFYDFFARRLQFNILKIDWKTNPPSHSLMSTSLYPYLKAELVQAAQMVGFTNLEIYGDLKLSRFEDLKSANLVVIAEKLDYK